MQKRLYFNSILLLSFSLANTNQASSIKDFSLQTEQPASVINTNSKPLIEDEDHQKLVYLSNNLINSIKLLGEKLAHKNIELSPALNTLDALIKDNAYSGDYNTIKHALNDLDSLIENNKNEFSSEDYKALKDTLLEYNHDLKTGAAEIKEEYDSTTRRRKVYCSLLVRDYLKVGNTLHVCGNQYVNGQLHVDQSSTFNAPVTINFPQQQGQPRANALTVVGTTNLVGPVIIQGDLLVEGSIEGIENFIPDGSITTDKLADGSVTFPKLNPSVYSVTGGSSNAGKLVQRDANGNIPIEPIGGTFVADDGSAAAPTYTFSNDLDTGIYRAGDGEIGIASNGVNAATINSTDALFSGNIGAAGNITTATGLISGASINSLSTITAATSMTAPVFNGDLNGNATTATFATTAGSSTNFTGTLSGDVTGTQSATVVALVGGEPAADVAAATVTVENATSANTANTLVERDGSGNFSAGTITAALNGNAATATFATTAGSSTNFTGNLAGDVTGTQSATVVALVGGEPAADVAAATVTVENATSSNTANTLVERDGSGNFSAGTITAALSGNAATATFATTAGSSTNFTGTLSGDVTGTQSATVVALVGGEPAANVAAATVTVENATSANTPNTLIERDSTGSFIAGTGTFSTVISDQYLGDLGSAAAPTFTFSTEPTTGIYSSASNELAISTDGINRGFFNATGLSLNYNLVLPDSTTSAQGNIFKGSLRFIHCGGTGGLPISNLFVGRGSGNFTNTGLNNLGVGNNTLPLLIGSIQSNTALGNNAGRQLRTGSGNTFIGQDAGGNIGFGNGNIYINNGGVNNEERATRIGISSQEKCFIFGIRGRTTGEADAIPVLIDSAGQLGTVSSSRKYKENIQSFNSNQALSIVEQLSPVTFNYKKHSNKTAQLGLIAEDVDTVYSPLVIYKDGEPETVKYHELPILLLAALKESLSKTSELKEKLTMQENTINSLHKEVEFLKSTLFDTKEY